MINGVEYVFLPTSATPRKTHRAQVWYQVAALLTDRDSDATKTDMNFVRLFRPVI